MVSSKLSSRLHLFEAHASSSEKDVKLPVKNRRNNRQLSLRLEDIANSEAPKASDLSQSDDSATSTSSFNGSSRDLSVAAADPISDEECFKAGIGDESFTSFDHQMRLAIKREQIRRRRDSAKLLGLPANAQAMSLKERMKAFQQK